LKNNRKQLSIRTRLWGYYCFQLGKSKSSVMFCFMALN
jgi:hypothetical protein